MAPKMVTNFRRSLSFPDELPSNKASKPKKNLHIRSASLPCQSHPIISQLKDEIADLNAWSVSESGFRTSAWLCHGLNKLKSVHESLDDLLLLPQSRESLRGGECYNIIEKFLEEFLKFVDVYGIFQTLILRLKEEYSSMQIAMRRNEESKIAVISKNLNKIGKEIDKLVYEISSIGKAAGVPAGPSCDGEAELVEVINDVVKVTVLISISLFGGISESLPWRKTSTFMGMSFGKKMKNVIVEGGIREFQEINFENVLRKEEVKIWSKKMHQLEDCIVEIEGCGEKAFRSLINTRVSLLNVLTQ